MSKPLVGTAAVLLLAGGLAAGSVRAQSLQVSVAQAEAAGKKLWKNECGGTVAGLTSWNAGEDFASLGIGHYIWYPAGRREGFEESFPELVAFLQANGMALPAWLHPGAPCPWNSRTEFLRDQAGERMSALRRLLADTVPWQARFSAGRLEAALPKMLAAVPPEQRERVQRQFQRVAASPNGVYALVDYVNFKGEGVLPTERYRGQGWGLLQVLAGMQTDPASGPGREATGDFSRSAARVLTQRVANSPVERNEGKWLPGWKNRVITYAP